MRVLITGNLGYVGAVLTEELRNHNSDWFLGGIDSGLFAHCLTSSLKSPDTLLDQQVYVDLRDVSPDLLSGFDALVHLGAISNDPIGNAFQQVTEGINVEASLRILSMAKASGIRRLVFASSCSIYGKNDEGACAEDATVAPLSTYAKSKVMVETFLRQLSAPDFQVSCLRFATACGFSPRWRTDLVLNEFVSSAIRTGTSTVLSDGTPWRPLIHVRDMSRAVAWALTDRSELKKPFLATNVGSDEWNFQVRDLAEAVASRVQGSTISWNEEGKADPRSYRVDFSLFRSLAPQHQPEYSLGRAIDEMVAGMKDTGSIQTLGFSLRRLEELRRLMTLGLLNSELRWVESSP